LLAFARVGEAALQPEVLDVTALTHEIVGEVRSASPQQSATVSIAPDLRVVADRSLFRIALANLISNAWKYTQRTSEASIEIGATEGDGLFVKDNGIGFDMTDYPSLFAPFQRLQN